VNSPVSLRLEGFVKTGCVFCHFTQRSIIPLHEIGLLLTNREGSSLFSDEIIHHNRDLNPVRRVLNGHVLYTSAAGSHTGASDAARYAAADSLSAVALPSRRLDRGVLSGLGMRLGSASLLCPEVQAVKRRFFESPSDSIRKQA
jgi:hypothetical protein